MHQAIIESTEDISEVILNEFARLAELPADVEICDQHFIMRSAEPPSWISLIAESSWWVKLFAGAAALYTAELVKEAAKETWKNRVDIYKRLGTSVNTITKLGLAFLESKKKCKDHSYLVVNRTQLFRPDFSIRRPG